ncbi:MAG: hypothetical protein Fur0010_06470 [Bdellovibrio sp.]
MKFINEALIYISKNDLFGVLPLDILFHYIIGVILTIGLLKAVKNNLILALIGLLIIELLKEYYDSFTMTASLGESLKDIFVTLIHPIMLIIIRKLTKKPLTGNQEYYR